MVKTRPCRGGQENPGEAPISPKGPRGCVNTVSLALKCDRCHLSKARLSLISNALFSELECVPHEDQGC